MKRGYLLAGWLVACVLPALGQQFQYKLFARDAIAHIEDGNIETAIGDLNAHLEAYPNDPEFYFALAVAYTQQGELSRALDYTRQALAGGLPASRFLAGPHRLLEPLLADSTFQTFVPPNSIVLLHGPLLGDISDQSVRVWVRTAGEQAVQVQYWPSDDPIAIRQSVVTRTQRTADFTARVPLDQLAPNTTYAYQVAVAGQVMPETWHFRTYGAGAQPGRFQVGFGGGAGYTPEYERMWNTIASRNPRAFLLLGDNVYIDHPTRPATQQFCYYRRQSRPEFRQFTATTPIYAIWDDHDFGENDSWGGPAIDEPAWKPMVWDIFRQNWNNPAYGGGEEQPGVWFDFSIGDVDFFLLDGRYYRTMPDTEAAPSMLGPAQMAWIKERLDQSTATFKVVASPVPWAFGAKSGTQMTPSGARPGAGDTWEGFPDEREDLFAFIEDQRIDGVVLISADRHRSDHWFIERPSGYGFHEFESSKLTNIHTHGPMPGARFSYNTKHSFGLLTFDTTKPDPEVTYQVLSIDNELVYTFTLSLSDASF